MFALRDIAETVRKTPPNKTQSGSYALFIPINKEWGLKLYSDSESVRMYCSYHGGAKSVRNKTYMLQKYAALYGLGPKVGNKFTVTVNKVKYFGYSTERVDILPHFISEYQCERKIKGYVQLINDLYSLEMTPADLNSTNVGRIKGKLVCIDFSEF